MMPIPDTVVAKEIETADQAKLRERWELVNKTCNDSLRCAIKCESRIRIAGDLKGCGCVECVLAYKNLDELWKD